MKKNQYMIRIFWSDEDKCYIGEVPELKGCSGLGKTPEEALHEAAKSINNWLAVAKKEKITIPKPISIQHSGRLNLRLPRDIIDRIKRDAKDHAMSLNQYLLWKLA